MGNTPLSEITADQRQSTADLTPPQRQGAQRQGADTSPLATAVFSAAGQHEGTLHHEARRAPDIESITTGNRLSAY